MDLSAVGVLAHRQFEVEAAQLEFESAGARLSVGGTLAEQLEFGAMAGREMPPLWVQLKGLATMATWSVDAVGDEALGAVGREVPEPTDDLRMAAAQRESRRDRWRADEREPARSGLVTDQGRRDRVVELVDRPAGAATAKRVGRLGGDRAAGALVDLERAFVVEADLARVLGVPGRRTEWAELGRICATLGGEQAAL